MPGRGESFVNRFDVRSGWVLFAAMSLTAAAAFAQNPTGRRGAATGTEPRPGSGDRRSARTEPAHSAARPRP